MVSYAYPRISLSEFKRARALKHVPYCQVFSKQHWVPVLRLPAPLHGPRSLRAVCFLKWRVHLSRPGRLSSCGPSSGNALTDSFTSASAGTEQGSFGLQPTPSTALSHQVLSSL